MAEAFYRKNWATLATPARRMTRERFPPFTRPDGVVFLLRLNDGQGKHSAGQSANFAFPRFTFSP